MADKPLKHIAVIMDGNGRWAASRFLPRSEGHRRGAERVVDFIKYMDELDIDFVTLYAFSTENWKRSEEEVTTLMNLLCEFLDKKLDVMLKNKIRLMTTGRIDRLPQKCVERLEKVTEATSKDYRRTMILALNYGGRAEIVDACRKIASDVKSGKIEIPDITEEVFSKNLYNPEIPDPDLLIRTSGECRLSNFLLWELSYSEFYFSQVHWPDFDFNELMKAVNSYNNRNRRFGGRK